LRWHLERFAEPGESGYVSARAAMIYQHEARGADKAITDAIDARVDDEARRDDLTWATFGLDHFCRSLTCGLAIGDR
jgi:hypothetical protein